MPTALEQTQACLARIAALNPQLNAVIELNPQAEAIAAELDAERQARGPRGPLHGRPVLIKDNIDAAGPMMTTAGSLALEGHRAAQDAGLVQRLRAAGLVILGKTNLSEWANFRSSRSSSGWSSRGGQTANAHDPRRNPSGSSSGSAVAVAAGLCDLAVGTETDGSIISPAHANGIVGLKPTAGLVSQAGIIPISRSQDTAGPMAASVADVAALLRAMADAAAPQAGAPPAAPARVGVARNFFGFDDRVDAILERCLSTLSRLGAVIVDNTDLPGDDALGQHEMAVLEYEFKDGLNRYLAGVAPDLPVRSLDDLIDFNTRHAERLMPHFGQERLLRAQARGPLSEPAYTDALAACRRLSRDEGIDRVMRQHQLDALVAPSGGPAWLTDYVNGDTYRGGSSSPAAVAGYPSISLPAGRIAGLPVGISLIAGAWQEPALLRLAAALEAALALPAAPPTWPPRNEPVTAPQ
jgi:amidase